ncbi:MAG: hypothetical protein AAF741_09860 [Bacteroidota bacterium]
MIAYRSISFWVYIILCYVLVRVAFMAYPWREGRVINYDIAGYYLPLPAYFIYDDITEYKYYDNLATNYGIAGYHEQTVDLPNGNKVMKYSLGMSILYSPGFFVAHQMAKRSRQYAADGYSVPYYFYISMWSLLWAFWGLWILRKLLLHYFSEITTSITLALLVISTNYLIYAGIGNLMSHSYLFTLYALLLYQTKSWHDKPKWITAVSIGLILGIMIITRPTEIIAALIPILWGIGSRESNRVKIKKFRDNYGQLLLAVLATIAVGSIQLFYWKAITGNWLFYSYEDQGFDFLNPKLWQGAFSFTKGWLIYTPIMIFAVIGFRWLYKQQRQIFWALLAFSLINFYIVYSWKIWTYGGSIGSRAMVQSYAVWCFPLAAFVHYIVHSASRFWKLALAVVVVFFTDLNLTMTWASQAEGGMWHSPYMTQAYYTRIAGRVHVENETRKFLDISTELKPHPDHRVDTLILETFDQEKDSVLASRTEEHHLSPPYSYRVDGVGPAFGKEVQLPKRSSYKNIWLRARVDSYFTQMEWEEYRLARFDLLFYRDGEVIDGKSVRIQWLNGPWAWHDIHYEVPLYTIYDGTREGDYVRVVLQNGGGDRPIFFDNLVLEWVEI